jgi:hypothetical protein
MDMRSVVYYTHKVDGLRLTNTVLFVRDNGKGLLP